MAEDLTGGSGSRVDCGVLIAAQRLTKAVGLKFCTEQTRPSPGFHVSRRRADFAAVSDLFLTGYGTQMELVFLSCKGCPGSCRCLIYKPSMP